MKHQFILTPYYLGDFKQELKDLIEKDWLLNEPALKAADSRERINEVHTAIKEQVSKVMEEGRIPVAMNGDCLSAIGVLAALQKNNVSPIILWFDAHGDFNTFETTISGYIAGMSLAMITGRGDQQYMNGVRAAAIPDDAIILADARDLDPGEKDLIHQSHIHWFKSIHEIKSFPFQHRPVYIHFDVDIINAMDAPATLFPTPGGPSKQALADLFQYLSTNENICCISVTPWAPTLDANDQTKKTCMELIYDLAGK